MPIACNYIYIVFNCEASINICISTSDFNDSIKLNNAPCYLYTQL